MEASERGFQNKKPHRLNLHGCCLNTFRKGPCSGPLIYGLPSLSRQMSKTVETLRFLPCLQAIQLAAFLHRGHFIKMLQCFCWRRHTSETHVVGERRWFQCGAPKTRFFVQSPHGLVSSTWKKKLSKNCEFQLSSQRAVLQKCATSPKRNQQRVMDLLARIQHYCEKNNAGTALRCNQYHCHVCEGQQSIIIIVVLIL